MTPLFRVSLILLQLFIVLSNVSVSSQNEDSYLLGVEAYTKTAYKKASDFFKKSLDEDPQNSDILTNLALSEYQLGHVGLSLGYLRKALNTNPHHSSALQTLHYIQSHNSLRETSRRTDFFETLRTSVLNGNSLQAFLLLSAFLLFSSGWTWIRYFTKRQYSFRNEEAPPTFPVIGSICLFFCLVSFGLTTAKIIDSMKERATIIVDKISVRLGPEENQPALFELYEGTEVIQLKTNKDWSQVRYPGGLVGWLPSQSLMVTDQVAQW